MSFIAYANVGHSFRKLLVNTHWNNCNMLQERGGRARAREREREREKERERERERVY